MKKKIISVLIIFAAFFFLLPNKTKAASCTSQNGHCDFAITCSRGTPIKDNDCAWGWVCCPNITALCESLGGECKVAASCAIGKEIDGLCGDFQTCCPIITASCESLGGECKVAASCASGTPLDGLCGNFQTCCPPTPIKPSPSTSDVLCKPTGGEANSGIRTAIGCVPVLNNDNGTAFMAFVLRWAVGIGGGIAFLLILYGGFMIMSSSGNPERLKAGQELLTSAISGLILLIFSVFVLKFIGVDILGLGAFGFGK